MKQSKSSISISGISDSSRTSILPGERVVRPRERRIHECLIKRTIDLVGAATLLCFLSPVLVVLIGVIWITDGAPIFYLRQVVGSQGEFYAYKFRTMCRDADSLLAANHELHSNFRNNFKLRSDPRVTAVGAWLRRYSLDELPQLLNVLKGQMSLVGPRMITAPELSKYGPYQELLMTVKPGLTGYWQIQGRQDVSYDERVRMDVHYITHWSLGLDLRILLETPWIVIKGKGAY